MISQSGRSPDVLAVQSEARSAGVPTVSITNDTDSPLGRDADICLPMLAGPELSVTATKTFITSVALAAAIVSECSGAVGLAAAIRQLPEDLEKANDLRWPQVEDTLLPAQSLYVLARGPTFPIADEAALKLKETCALHAEGFSAAEVMHGPVELVRAGFPILVFAPGDAAFPQTSAAVARLREAGGSILWPQIHRTAHWLLHPISIIQSFYRCAERVAKARGRDPDQPRMLTKVTQTI
jgi:glucosamine--fructose-6-phosphate aminotransferase (isomerizing)